MATISYFAFGNISDTPIAAIFLSDGSIVQSNTSTQAITSMAPAGTILTPANPIGLSQWGSQYILMCAPQTNGYFIWDGTVFYQAGSVAPTPDISNNGAGYTSQPTITARFGHGSGSTYTATLSSSGTISKITPTNAGTGYIATDAVVLGFSGGGGPTTALATASLAGTGVGSVSISNAGSGYTSQTSVIFLGGGGFGATATVTASGGVSAVTVTAHGEGYTSAPAVSFSDPNNAVVQATIPIMPFGVQGSTLETFTNRVWVSNGGASTSPPAKNLSFFTAPSNPADFSATNGGGSFISNDSFLRVGYHALKQSNGFLYLIADSSVNNISGVQTAGDPAITTFSNQNVDPQIGSPWANTVQVFSRSIVFANTFGVHALYGGAVQKVSTQLDGIFTSITPTGSGPSYGGLVPSSGVCIIFGIHVYVLLLPIIDQVTGAQVNKLLCWDGKKWFTAQPSVTLTQIAAQEINSVLTLYGTDGTSIYPLFQTPSTAIIKTVQSKFWDTPSYIMGKTALRTLGLIQENTGNVANVTISVDSENGSQAIPVTNAIAATWYNNANQVATWLNNVSLPATWQASGTAPFIFSLQNVFGSLIGMTVSSTAKDLTLISVATLTQQYRLFN